MRSKSVADASPDAGKPIRSTYFWIAPDSAANVRWVKGSATVLIPGRLQDAILSSQFEDWCLDNLEQGVLAEWAGLDLYLHFASKSDRILTQLRWF
jgi:hypothetical protein